MKTPLPPTVAELNAIQREWMALQPDAPEPEKKRVIDLMNRCPRGYVSGHDGRGVFMLDGLPTTVPMEFEQALEQCRRLGFRTDIAWNGATGEWYEIQPQPTKQES